MHYAKLSQFVPGARRTPELVHEYEGPDGRIDLWRDRGYLFADIRQLKRLSRRARAFLNEQPLDGIKLSLHDIQAAGFDSLEFLADFPPLRYLSVQVDRAKIALDPICELASLECLQLFVPVLSSFLTFDWGAFDFRRLPNLIACGTTFIPKHSSLLACRGLRSLTLGGPEGRSKTIDLGRLDQLRELVLVSPKCREIVWGAARPVALGLISTRKLPIDWDHLAPTLAYLEVGGNVDLDLTELAVLRKLRVLEMSQLKTIPPLDFLLDLPELKAVNYAVPRGPCTNELSEHNEQVMAEINARHGYGAIWRLARYQPQHVGWE